MKPNIKQCGMSLLEVAIVMSIMSIMGLGALKIYPRYVTYLNYQNNQLYLEQAQSALHAYLIKYGRLPCPDRDGDGQEDNQNQNCNHSSPVTSASDVNQIVTGFLPSVELGVLPHDVFGRSLFYAVTLHYADSLLPDADNPIDPSQIVGELCHLPSTRPGLSVRASFNFCSHGVIEVRDGENRMIAKDLPYLLWSQGRNGSQAMSSDEQKNQDGNRLFVRRPFASHQSKNGFDDQLIWESSPSLALLLLKAHILP